MGKNIFVISPYPIYPVVDGAARRIEGICRQLIASGCELSLFSPASGKPQNSKSPSEDHIRQIHFISKCKYHRSINSGLKRVLKQRIEERPDLIIMNFPYFSRIIYPIAKEYRVPVHLDEHNIEYLRFMDMGRPLVAIAVFFLESYAIKNAGSISVTTNIDADYIKQRFKRESIVIENFIDSEKFYPIDDQAKNRLKNSLGLNFPKIVCYFGNFTNISTQQAYKIIIRDIAPPLLQKDSQIKIMIMGRGLKDTRPVPENIIIAGEVEKIEDYIRVSDLAIVPLTSGGGTRFKILEALGCGIPVISTSKGAEGLNLKGSSGLIISKIDRFADNIVRFFQDSSVAGNLRLELGSILQRYSIEHLKPKLKIDEAILYPKEISYIKNRAEPKYSF